MKLLAVVALLVLSVPSSLVAFDSASVGVGVDATLESDAAQPFLIAPRLDASFSFSGYPTMALSWFVDGAGELSFPLPEAAISATGVVVAGASARAGLTSVRADVESAVNATSGGGPVYVELTPVLGFSTGTPLYSVFAETKGSGIYSSEHGSWALFGNAEIGFSVSILNRLAPALEISGSYSSLWDATESYTIGASLDIPWYPSLPGTFSLRAGLLRSGGTAAVESSDGAVYYPDRYWELWFDVSGAYAFSKALSLELRAPGSVARADHGALIAGEPGDALQITTTLTPSAKLTVRPVSGLSISVQGGATFRLSNSAYLQSTLFFASLGTHYTF